MLQVREVGFLPALPWLYLADSAVWAVGGLSVETFAILAVVGFDL